MIEPGGFPLQFTHPFRPDETGTQCAYFGYWGWADDPRHVMQPIGPQVPIRSYGRRMIRVHGHRWESYGPCSYLPCSAGEGKPCTTSTGERVGYECRTAHAGRPVIDQKEPARV